MKKRAMVLEEIEEKNQKNILDSIIGSLDERKEMLANMNYEKMSRFECR